VSRRDEQAGWPRRQDCRHVSTKAYPLALQKLPQTTVRERGKVDTDWGIIGQFRVLDDTASYRSDLGQVGTVRSTGDKTGDARLPPD
jgi:hypothetical protein